MKLRSAIALTILLALAAALLVTAAVVSVVLDRTARRALTQELARERAALEDMIRYRKSLHRAESRVLADEPRLKAVAATEDVTEATILGVISDLRRALRCDLLLMTDAQGRLIADSAHPKESGQSLADVPAIATALANGESEGLWTEGHQVFQVHGRRISYGTMPVGAIIVGYSLDDALAESVGRHIGAGVVMGRGQQVIAASRFEGDVVPSRAELAAVLATVPRGDSPQELRLGGARYLTLKAAPSEPSLDQGLYYAVFRSLDVALAPARGLVRILYGLTASALGLAALMAILLSRRLTRPIDGLVRFAQRIAAGNLEPVDVGGPQEVRELGSAMNEMAREIATARIEIAEKTRLAKEIEIAQRIQLSILPRELTVPGLSLAALMVPATEVGGDYYDVVPCEDGCWLGIGDVAGHGLPAGLVMLMVQSSFATLVRSLPDAAPRQITVLLNQLVFDNVRNRLSADEHVTFSAVRYYADGRMVFAGAHEPLVVLRARDRKCELIPTPGTWLGVIPDITRATQDTTLHLSVGDVVILYSDGVTEAKNERDEQLGIERLCEAAHQCAGRSTAEIHSHIMHVVRSWSRELADDVTLLVLCHEGRRER